MREGPWDSFISSSINVLNIRVACFEGLETQLCRPSKILKGLVTTFTYIRILVILIKQYRFRTQHGIVIDFLTKKNIFLFFPLFQYICTKTRKLAIAICHHKSKKFATWPHKSRDMSSQGLFDLELCREKLLQEWAQAKKSKQTKLIHISAYCDWVLWSYVCFGITSKIVSVLHSRV